MEFNGLLDFRDYNRVRSGFTKKKKIKITLTLLTFWIKKEFCLKGVVEVCQRSPLSFQFRHR